MNIYIFNVSSDVQSEDLKNMFAVYGEVQSAEIVRDIISGESRGYGFIEMEDEKDAQTAIAALDQTEIDSLCVTVRENNN